jgi:hypothetical protein
MIVSSSIILFSRNVHFHMQEIDTALCINCKMDVVSENEMNN